MAEPKKAPKDGLASAVERERKRASVRSLDVSFAELADMYRTGELKITPEYQRTFRWSETKQSQFIESIVLEMPVPPIYAVEVGEAEWELIDGLQRLSTYLHFRGELDLPDREPPIRRGEALSLSGCDILKELNDYSFTELTTTLQHRIRRATLRVEVVRRESNPRFAYYMFNRLNSGGEPLSEQETRNCSIRLLGTQFNDFIVNLRNDPNFRITTDDLGEEQRSRMEDVEMILRFFAFKNNLEEYVHDIEPFLTDFMVRVTDQTLENHVVFEYTKEEAIFRKTFAILANTLAESTCRRWVETSKSYGGGFSRSHFEAFSIGVALHVDKLPIPSDEHSMSKLMEALVLAKKDVALRPLTTGGGKNFKRLYERKISLVTEHVARAL